jgi:putative SOS response-associated peptidase YedK
MCGRFNITDDPFTRMLCEQLGLFGQPSLLRFSADIAPASTISIIKQDLSYPAIYADQPEKKGRCIVDAIWWLLLSQQQDGFKANDQYASFNSRSDKLNNPQAIAYQPYRTSRCIIPASSFVEGQDQHYHQLTPVDSAIAFGGLYQSWHNKYSGELTHSASIITLPGHPKLEHIHRKSMPLMLPLDNTRLIDAWLDPNVTRLDKFEPFLHARLRQSFIATPIDKPSKRQPIGTAEIIPADD